MSYLGASIEDIGVSSAQVSGDPVMALIAQLNRFAGKTVKPPGTADIGGKGCGTRTYLPRGPIPLSTTLSDHAATIANVMMYDSYNCGIDERLLDFKKLKSINAALTNPVPWAMANLKEITIKLSQYGDVLGLNAAAVGITTRDPRLTPKFPVMTVMLLGLMAVAAVVVSRRK